jgi:peptide/nickel transport system substrate-binding protein
MYDGLLHYKDGTPDVEPGLATSWTISEDGKTYTFKIREGVKYHDGSDVNAESIKFALDRVYDKTNPFNATTGPFPFAFELGPINATEAVDKYTLAVHLDAPYSPMLTMLASSIGGLAGVSPAAVKEYGKEFSRHGGGSGPFKVKLWESNQQVVLEANPTTGRARQTEGPSSSARSSMRTRVDASGGIDITIEVPPDNVATFTADRKFVLRPGGPHSGTSSTPRRCRLTTSWSARRRPPSTKTPWSPRS